MGLPDDNPEWADSFLELEMLVESDPLAQFVPSPALLPFMSCTSRFVLLRAANQIGKTYQVCARLAQVMVNHPNGRYRVSGASRDQTHRVMGGYLWTFLKRYCKPNSRFTEGKGWNGPIVLQNGCTCEFKSGEDHPQTHAGPALHGVVLDEVPKRAIMTETIARVASKRGFIWVAMTPVDRPVDWFKAAVQEDGSMWVEFVVEYSRANCPWLSEEQAREHMEAMRTAPWQYEQRIKGAWDGITTDRWFEGFTEGCLSSEYLRVNVTWRVGLAMDHGEKAGRQTALLCLYRVHNGRVLVHILDEYVSSRATGVEEDAAAILAMLKRNNLGLGHIDKACGDTNAGKDFNGSKINHRFERAFARLHSSSAAPFRIRDAYKADPNFGLRILNWMMGRGELTVNPRCQHFIKTCRHWQGANDDLKHMADTARYLATLITEGQSTYDRVKQR